MLAMRGGGAKPAAYPLEILRHFQMYQNIALTCLPFLCDFAGGKTPDPSKRSYADVIAEARLRAEEVS